MKDYKKYSNNKLINIYNTLKDDYKKEQDNPCNIVNKVYIYFLQCIKSELIKRNIYI